MKRLNLTLLILIVFAIGCETETSITSSTSKIVVQYSYWAKPGMENDVYLQGLIACSIRKKLGHSSGKILKLKSDTNNMPDIIWQCEYPGMKSWKKDVDRLSKNSDFQEVIDEMNNLVKRYDKAIYEVAKPPSGME
ncbi:MAG: hypothetical protein ABFS32_09575 [Bacteroidota bacterium]